jgi:hypothetical protein
MKAGRRDLAVVERSQVYPDKARYIGRASDICQVRNRKI